MIKYLICRLMQHGAFLKSRGTDFRMLTMGWLWIILEVKILVVKLVLMPGEVIPLYSILPMN